MNTLLPSAPWLDRDLDNVESLSVRQLADRFGDIPATRICLEPPPGHATEADLHYYQVHEDRLFELVDGVLIDKATPNLDSLIGGNVLGAIFSWLRDCRIGFVLPGNALFRLSDRVIRSPSVAYLTLERGRPFLAEKCELFAVAPNLAALVISDGNSQKEMTDKLQEYFRAGTEEVWYVYPETRELHQFTSSAAPMIHKEGELITTPLLPGFEMKLMEIFQLPGE